MPRSGPDTQKMAAEKDIGGLTKLLHSGVAERRQAAADALASISDPLAAKPLIHALRSQSSLHWVAFEALAHMGAPAVEPLMAVVRGADENLRYVAADLLGAIGAPAVETLTAALHDRKSWVVFHAIRALGQIKDDRSVDALLNVLADEASPFRDDAAKALGQLKDPRAVDGLTAALDSVRAVDGLVALLNQNIGSLRREAEEALEAIRKATAEAPPPALPQEPVMREPGIAVDAPGPQSEPFLQTPDPSDPDEYVRRCLEAEFPEQREPRTHRSDPAFASVLTPLNARQYAQAIAAGKVLVPLFPDLDLLYKWMGTAYRGLQQLPESRLILMEGLRKAKRKSLLLTDLGETELECGDVHAAVYWWVQAVHCLASNPVDANAYLLLAHVAHELGLRDAEQAFRKRVDRGIDLDVESAKRLAGLVRSQQAPALPRALEGLQSGYSLAEPQHPR